MGLLYDEDYNLVHIKRFDGFSEKQTFDEGLLTESENALGEEELSSYTENFRLSWLQNVRGHTQFLTGTARGTRANYLSEFG